MSFKLPKPASGGDLLTWASAAWEAMRRSVPIAGPGIRISITSSGTVISAEPAKSPAVAPRIEGPFCGLYKQEGRWMLMGGTVTGGSGNVTVSDFVIAVSPTTPDDGDKVWIVATGAAVTDDGVLLAGINLTTATTANGAVFPAMNTIPTAAAPTGVLNILLGSWSNGVFVPSNCGNIQLTHCPGTLSHVRL